MAKAAGAIRVIAVNDAVYPCWFADVCYAADREWWRAHRSLPGFPGEKWSSQGNAQHDDKRGVADALGLKLMRAVDGPGFSLDADRIHYGGNSGFQALNCALHWTPARKILVGFDMRQVEGRRHFFGDHPPGLRPTTSGYTNWPKAFARAAAALPAGVDIVNCTPQSALSCFKPADLAVELARLNL